MTAEVEIDSIKNGYLIKVEEAFVYHRTEYAPTFGQALAKVLYRMVRKEGDIPEPHSKGYSSEMLQTIMVFLKTTGPKAVEDALKDNYAKVKDDEEIITEEGSQDI